MGKTLEVIEKSVREASKILKNVSAEKYVERKSSFKDLVTEYDREVQKILFDMLTREFPSAGFLCEEGLNIKDQGAGMFIIDPIDGTTNFIKGLNHSAICVGFYKNGDIECGCVYNPFTDEMFTAEDGKGAYLNGERIRVSDEDISRSVGLYGTSPYNEKLREKSFRLANEITKRVIDSRRMGSAELDMCYVACGRAELYAEYELSPWDYAAGYIIAREAGAIVSSMDGEKLTFTSKSSVVAATPKTYPIIMDMIKSVEQ